MADVIRVDELHEHVENHAYNGSRTKLAHNPKLHEYVLSIVFILSCHNWGSYSLILLIHSIVVVLQEDLVSHLINVGAPLAWILHAEFLLAPFHTATIFTQRFLIFALLLRRAFA